MELENLKTLWQTHVEETLPQHLVSREELMKMLRAKSSDVIEKIKKSIRNETIILLCCLPIYILVAFLHPTLFGRIFSWAFTLLILPFLYFLWRKNREMNRFFTLNQDLKTSLTQLITKLEKALRFSFLVNIALMPFALPLGFYAGFTFSLSEAKMIKLWEKLSLGSVHPVVWGLMAVLVFVGSFAIGIPYVRWWIRYFYGQHLEKLKTHLAELEELETA